MKTKTILTSLSFALALTFTTHAADITPAEARAIAKEAYIYGFPIVDKGMARSFTTDTMHSGIYAFTFDQQGLMAGLGLQGSKIMRID